MDKDDLERIEWERERRSLGHLLWRLKQWLVGLPCRVLGHRWPPQEVIESTVGIGQDFATLALWEASLPPRAPQRRCRRCGLQSESRLDIGRMAPQESPPPPSGP